MARELGGEAPLVETDASSKRLVREDEQGGSDDEDEKRIVFSGVKQKSQRQKIAEEIGKCAILWCTSVCWCTPSVTKSLIDSIMGFLRLV